MAETFHDSPVKTSQKQISLSYRCYSAMAAYDVDAKLFHGEVQGIRDVITFQADSAEELPDALRASVDEYLAWCAERGEEPNIPLGK